MSIYDRPYDIKLGRASLRATFSFYLVFAILEKRLLPPLFFKELTAPFYSLPPRSPGIRRTFSFGASLENPPEWGRSDAFLPCSRSRPFPFLSRTGDNRVTFSRSPLFFGDLIDLPNYPRGLPSFSYRCRIGRIVISTDHPFSSSSPRSCFVLSA